MGVAYSWNKAVLPDASDETYVVRASKLVVLSAGTLGSPLVLERSGIGATTVLQKHGVTQVVDLPGVGEKYHGQCLNAQLY